MNKNPFASSLRQRIADILTAPEVAPGAFGRLRISLSRVFGKVSRVRSSLFARGVLKAHRMPCRVISVGNITVGGTGKTPMTLYLAEFLKEIGFRSAILSRGYRGRAEKTGGIVSDGKRILMGSDAAGDEPYLMARLLEGVPVLVGADRVKNGWMAVKRFHPEVILLDDGFQHLRMERDLNLLLLDAENPVGNGFPLPAGVLREPVAAIQRADAVIFTRTGGCEIGTLRRKVERIPFVKGKPLFFTHHTPILYSDGQGKLSASAGLNSPKILSGKRLTLFSGIARNEDFQKSILQIGGIVKAHLEFPDHHPYPPEDLEKIGQLCRLNRSEALVTTAKDFVRIPVDRPWPIPVFVLDVRVRFGQDTDRFRAFLKDRIGGHIDSPLNSI